MTKQEAESFFARNPSALEDMQSLQRDGLIDKMEGYYLGGRASSEQDAMVNCIAAFRTLGQTPS
jgi:hypothetical protein